MVRARITTSAATTATEIQKMGARRTRCMMVVLVLRLGNPGGSPLHASIRAPSEIGSRSAYRCAWVATRTIGTEVPRPDCPNRVHPRSVSGQRRTPRTPSGRSARQASWARPRVASRDAVAVRRATAGLGALLLLAALALALMPFRDGAVRCGPPLLGADASLPRAPADGLGLHVAVGCTDDAVGRLMLACVLYLVGIAITAVGLWLGWRLTSDGGRVEPRPSVLEGAP
jgi:hypothetical protein